MPNTLFSDNSHAKETVTSPPLMGDSASEKRPWKVLLVDDEPDVITVSKMALRGLYFQGSKVKILTASSATEARKVLSDNSDIALAFVDVVMETDSAGLELIRWIREERNDQHIRLVLRTGQPALRQKKLSYKSMRLMTIKTKPNSMRLD